MYSSKIQKAGNFIVLFGMILLDSIVIFFLLLLPGIMGNSMTVLNLTRSRIFFLGIQFSLFGILQTFISVFFVLEYEKKGLWIQTGLNSFSVILILWLFIRKNPAVAISDIVTPVFVVLVSVILYRHLTGIKVNMTELNRLAFSDDLTGLVNRKKIISDIKNLITGGDSVPRFSIMLIDLDNFKSINDSLGHQVGDVFLKEIVHNIQPILCKGDTLGRMGGDEFLVLVPSVKSNEELIKLGNAINKVVSLPVLYKSRKYIITCSIGIARYPNDGQVVSDLLRFADIALYQAKIKGRNNCLFFNHNMRMQLEQRVQMEHELHSVLEHQELYTEVQPQYNLSDRTLRGFEVLARWNSPVLGRVNPVVFIPLAEENGDILVIGKWIMRQCFTDYVATYGNQENSPILAVNVSTVQFRDQTIFTDIRDILEQTGMNPKNVEFEITESFCLSSPAVARKYLERIHDFGIKIALDDFGTGYSALSYLRTLPFDILKIDKSFVDTILTVPEEKNLVKTIITMAHQLDLAVVAEGVEKQEQVDFLTYHHCDMVQGYYFARPRPTFLI